MRNLLIVAVLAAAGWGAYANFHRPDPLKTLLEVPALIPPNSYGGMRDITNLNVEVGPEPGRHTVIEFYDYECSACLTVARHLQYLAQLRPDVSVKVIRINPDLASKFNIQGIPHVLIYDSDGHLLADDKARQKGGLDLLYQWMKQELKRNSDSEP
jgi:thiol-disulfide isomerase/thioredoxin